MLNVLNTYLSEPSECKAMGIYLVNVKGAQKGLVNFNMQVSIW